MTDEEFDRSQLRKHLPPGWSLRFVEDGVILSKLGSPWYTALSRHQQWVLAVLVEDLLGIERSDARAIRFKRTTRSRNRGMIKRAPQQERDNDEDQPCQ